MGIDVNALDQQVQEKKEREEKMRDDGMSDRLRNMEIERVVAESKLEEDAMKKYLNEDVKKDWETAIAYKQSLMKNKEPEPDPLKSGVSAAQNFAGADPFRKDRIKAQKEQMRNGWLNRLLRRKYYGVKTITKLMQKCYVPSMRSEMQRTERNKR